MPNMICLNVNTHAEMHENGFLLNSNSNFLFNFVSIFFVQA
jgi:hypothetical protein